MRSFTGYVLGFTGAIIFQGIDKGELAWWYFPVTIVVSLFFIIVTEFMCDMKDGKLSE